jgi:hypothetical protein
MTDQHDGGPSHPYRVLVPVLPLRLVLEQTGDVAKSEGLLRSRDTIQPYMYLPPLQDALDEDCVACLFRPSLVGDDFLADPPRRIAQLQPLARRHLKVKLAAYWSRVGIDPAEVRLHERDEDAAAAEAWPPSPYDHPDGPRAGFT